MTLGATLSPHGLAALGTVGAGADLPEGCQSLVLVGPAAGFWPIFSQSPEYHDGAADPLNRWSTRVLGAVAETLDATAIFPFGGPPWHPFIRWALDSGAAWQSPVTLLVHATDGLFVSYRGALGFRDARPAPQPAPRPCNSCAAPCTTACPVDALGPSGYDIAACHAFLDTAQGADCLTKGCRVRRACPVNGANRQPAHSAFHMAAFHPPARD